MASTEQSNSAGAMRETLALPSTRPAFVNKMERRLGAPYFGILEDFLRTIAAHARSADPNKDKGPGKNPPAKKSCAGDESPPRSAVTRRLADSVWEPLTAQCTNCAVEILIDISDYRERTRTAESRLTVQQFAEQRLSRWADSYRKYAEAVVFIGDVLQDDGEQSYPEWVLFGCWLLYRNVD